MKRLIALAALILLSVSSVAFAQDGHEYAPLEEKTINYKDWTFKSMKDERPVNLRQWAQGKKLALVVYFAPWCSNWKLEAPVVARLYDKYKAHGFDVIAVSNYATAADRAAYFSGNSVPYTVVIESDTRDARDKTAHYAYRQQTGDKRKWGSPYNVFLVPSRFNTEGEVLVEKTWIVNGELIEKDVEAFIREQLGLEEVSKP